MTRRLSRFLGGIELVMLVAPVSITAIAGMVILGRWGAYALPREPLPFMALLLYLALPVGVAIAALVALWRTLGAFVLSGPQALLQIPRVWWWILMAGCVFAVAAILYFGAERLGLISADAGGLLIPLGIGSIGAILLIPLMHIAIEYKRAMRSNNALEQTRDG